MRHRRSLLFNGTVLVSWLYCLLAIANGIMVPTGKLTPIQPAEPSSPPTPVPSTNRRAPAPVNEYTAENPEPPPLDPSYVPPQFSYIQYISPHGIIYVPMKLKPLYVHNVDKYNNYSKNKYRYEKYGTKLPVKVLQKYEDYPAHLQKKYIHHYLTQTNQA